MDRFSGVSIRAVELCGFLVALTVFSNALTADDTNVSNGQLKTQVKRSIASGSCYCCLATYDTSCCHACTSHWDAPIPFYTPEKKRDGSSSEVAPLFGDLQVSPQASITDLSLVSCACCQASQNKACCDMCKLTTGPDDDAAAFKNSFPSKTSGLIRKRGFNIGNAYSTCMCCTLTRWRGCCYRCPYGY